MTDPAPPEIRSVLPTIPDEEPPPSTRSSEPETMLQKLRPVKTIIIAAAIVLLLCVVVCVGVLYYPLLMEKLSASQLAGRPAPDFTLTTLDGSEVTLSELQGKPVVLNFWATWCPSCIKELPDLQQAYEKRRDDIHFLAISVESEVEPVRAFAEAKGLGFPVMVDTEGAVSKKYRVTGIPVTVFIDSQGTMVQRHIGSLSVEKFEELLAEAQSR